jgi:hypothetical protein
MNWGKPTENLDFADGYIIKILLKSTVIKTIEITDPEVLSYQYYISRVDCDTYTFRIQTKSKCAYAPNSEYLEVNTMTAEESDEIIPPDISISGDEYTPNFTLNFSGGTPITSSTNYIIGFDNKVLAGAWLPGQAENIFRVTNLSKRLNIPLVWLVNCSGVKLTEQEKFYAGRRGSGTTFYRHAELEQMGIPVLAGIYGTNPAGGGYQGISPTILFAHKNAEKMPIYAFLEDPLSVYWSP